MDDSAATIKFDDGTALHIGPNSELQLDDLVYSKKSKVLTGYLNLTKGKPVLGFSTTLPPAGRSQPVDLSSLEKK